MLTTSTIYTTRIVRGIFTTCAVRTATISFCELGAGHVNLAAMTEILLENDYDGLVIIELDASKKGAEVSARQSIEYVTQELGLKLNLS